MTGCETIQKAVFRCSDITRKLLTFVRKTDSNPVPCAICQIIDETVEEYYRQEFSVNSIIVERNYCDEEPVVLSDKNQLQQVFMNLINNAVDAITFPGKITINTIAINDFVFIDIEDTGKGMTQHQLEKIFMPFYSTKEVGKGTGLGLSISYGIIKSLGGEITVKSWLGKGSKFTIKLPVQERNVELQPPKSP